MATVKFFGNLRKVAGLPVVEVSGDNVGEILNELCKDNDALHDAIFENGKVKSFVRVMLNGQDVELAQGLDTKVSAISSIAIFPPIAGG